MSEHEKIHEAPARADQHHVRLLEMFQHSLRNDELETYERWGISLFHSLPDEQAEEQRMAFGREPQDALDFYNRGCLLACRDDYPGAIKYFSKALDLDGDMKEARFNLALALERAGDMAGARAAWDEFLKLHADSEEAADIKQHLSELA